VRLAERASERERLLIRARWANYLAVAAGRAVADSLVARYPAEVEGYLLAGLARVDAAEWAAARPLLARAAAMDSLSLRPGPAAAPCTACAALRAIAYSYQAEGLGAEAVRAAQQWTRLQPHGVGAWTTQGELLAMNGRYDEGRAALDSAIARDPRGAGAYALSPLVRLEIRSGRLAEAERLARGRVGVGSLAEHGAALWMLNFTLRNQGRAREAVEAARAYRAVRDSLAGGVAYSAESYMLGASLALAGRARESAAVFDSAARGLLRAGEDPASLARVRPLALTELAWAHYLAGDTAALAPLADRIEAASAGHAWRMAQAAHHQARGLQRAARGDALGAAAEWRAAVTSVLDHPRAKLLLGRALTRAGRPAEAVAALRPALGGWIDAMGAVPVAEVHEALAEAWTQVPGPAARDSAAAHWRFVADAWQHGDPPFAARAAAARRRLAAGP
jgi:tetratricopeptide (TPR) repeat protein